MYKLQHEFAQNLKSAAKSKNLEAGLNLIHSFKENYENTVLYNLNKDEDYYEILARDFCEIIGEFEKSWEYQKQRNRIHNLTENWHYLKRIAPKPLTAEVIVKSLGLNQLGLTKYGLENIDEVEKVVDQMLAEYYKENGDNPLCDIVSEFRIPILEGNRFQDLKKYFELNEDYEHWKEVTQKYCCNKYSKDKDLKTTYYLFDEPWFKSVDLYKTSGRDYIPNIVHKVISIYFEDLFRRAENEVRESEEIPKIGEGWIRETELFYKIKEEYSDFKVVQHATPDWLNGQHFDIYFPNKKIAIEYHGQQHFEPIDFFGGEEAFEKQEKRDSRKKRLSKENDCQLLIAKKGYDFKELKNKLNNLLTT